MSVAKARIIDGAALASEIRQQVKTRVAELVEQGRSVHLTALLVGSTHAGDLYAQRQADACRAVGIDYQLQTLPATASREDVVGAIQKLNRDPSVTGIMLHLPLPDHLEQTEIQYQIDP